MNDDEGLRTRLREPIERLRAPQPQLAKVVARARRLRTLRILAGSVAALVVALGVAVPIRLLSGIGGPPSKVNPAGNTITIRGQGLTIDLPKGWDGRVFYNADTTSSVLQFANRLLEPLLSSDDEVATATRSALGPHQAVVVLRELTDECPCPGFTPLKLPLVVDPDNCPCDTRGVDRDPSHAFVRMMFENQGRWFDLWADFGSDPAPPTLVEQVNGVLSTLSIVPTELPSAYEGWITHVDIQDRVSIDTPESWGFHFDPVPSLGEPRTLFAAGTQSPVPQGGECAPTNAIRELQSDGVLLWTMEYSDVQKPASFPPRPDQLTLDEGTLANYECSGDIASYLILFQDAGRYFQIHIAFGPEAGASERRNSEQALNTFQIVPNEDCLGTFGDPGSDHASFSASAGAPGDLVEVSGDLPFPSRGEGGQYVPPYDLVDVWWNDNTISEQGLVAPSGPPLELAGINVPGSCEYRLTFRVPDVTPGTYPVTVRGNTTDGYAHLGWENFTVTP